MNRKDFEHCACQPKLFSKGAPENQQVCDALGLHVQKSCPQKKAMLQPSMVFPGSFGNDSQATQKIRQLVEDHEDLFAVEKDQAEIP